MSIGRNDPCPCGSGKKYKKCCLAKEKTVSIPNEITSSDHSSAYSYIYKTSQKLSRVISHYNLADVIKAAFCLNSWRPNRSALSQCYTVNKAILMCNKFGNKSIKTYKDLSNFYKVISSYCVLSSWDDEIIDDFGEIYITYNNIQYPIITGTGDTQTFASFKILPYICDKLDKQDELLTLLSYIKCIILSLGPYNHKTQDGISYNLPSEEFWNNVLSLFESSVFKTGIIKTSSFIGTHSDQIERISFCIKQSEIYPLWNPGILMDYYHSLNPDKTEYPMDAVLSYLDCMYNQYTDPHKNYMLLKPTYINSSLKRVTFDSKLLLVLCTNNYGLVFVETDGTNAAEKTIEELEKKHSLETIHFAETFYRKKEHGNKGCSIEPTLPIYFIKVYNYTDTNSEFMLTHSSHEHPVCSLLDVVYMFSFAETDDIYAYFDDKSLNDISFTTFGGDSNRFFYWLDSQQALETGSEKLSFIFLDHNITEQYVYHYYREKMHNFPAYNSSLFSDPLFWTILGEEEGFTVIARKNNNFISGVLKKISHSLVIYIANSYQYFETPDSFHELNTAQNILIELCEKTFSRHSNWIETNDFLKEKTLYIQYLPYSHFYSKAKAGNMYTGKIITCSICIDQSLIKLYYTTDTNSLIIQLQNTTDRSYENVFFCDLMNALHNYLHIDNYKALEAMIYNDNIKSKTIGTCYIKQHYIYSPFSYDTKIKNASHIQVKNTIASICHDLGIQPGDYHGSDAKDLVRQIQAILIPQFERMLSLYNYIDMHKKLLNYYAYQLNGIYVHMHRYNAFTDLDTEVQQEFSEKTIKMREQNRVYKISAEYLIESNLYIQHNSCSRIVTDKEFNYLLALSYWLCDLQEISDVCFHFPDVDSFIRVDNKHIISLLREDINIDQLYKQGIKRKYMVSDYCIKYDAEDEKCADKMMTAFYQDTGVRFDIFTSLLEYICLDFIHELNLNESNYYEIDKQIIIHNYMNKVIDNTINPENVEDALNYIILDTTLLKTYGNNKQADILPIWERKNRNNRFEIKPMIEIDGKCIFSPVSIYQVCDMWKNGTCSWILPHEIGMNHMKKLLTAWKKRYEDMMVQDINLLFDKAGFTKSYPNMELCSRFPQENFPEELGDYDVFAINEQRAEIWLIESKVLHKVGSIYEDLMLQYGFFFQGKYDEKFQNRINYIQNNLEKIINIFKLEHNTYKIVPYMVTNKLFYSRYKELSFKIITYSELKDILCIKL